MKFTSKSCVFLSLILCIANVSYGDPIIRSPLFPRVVQDFVADLMQRLATEVPSIFSLPLLPREQLFTEYYNVVLRSNQEAGNPNAEFHALSKAQSVLENYDKLNVNLLITAIGYTAGELLLQKDLLTPSNQRSLSNAYADTLVNSARYAVHSFESLFRAYHRGYVNFLKSQGLSEKNNVFIPAAVYVEVINALAKNYQIPNDVLTSQPVPGFQPVLVSQPVPVYPNSFNYFVPNGGYVF